jgi:hypothetical protein
MQIYIGKAGEQTGPFTPEQVQVMYENGRIAPSDVAWHEGLSDWQPLHQVLELTPPVAQPPALPGSQPAMYLYISTARLIAMSIVSLGLYEAYWIYHNWRYLKERDRRQIMPFWRGIFGIFFIHSLLTEIQDDRFTNRILPATFSAGALATGWVVLMLIERVLGRIENPAMNTLGLVIGLPTVLFLVPVQKYINEVNEASGAHPVYYRFSAGHITCLVIGLLAWPLILLGLFA